MTENSGINDQIMINPNEVHIWKYPLKLPNDLLSNYIYLLSNAEKEQVNKIKISDLKFRSICSKLISKDILSRYLGDEMSNIKFSYNDYGKPIISKRNNQVTVNFNISHSVEMGIIAITKTELVGIDIEKIINLDDIDNIINLCFSDYEISMISELNTYDKLKMFYKIWTGKEAFIKAIGMGFSFNVKNISLSFNDDLGLSLKSVNKFPQNICDWKTYNFEPSENYTSTLVVHGYI